LSTAEKSDESILYQNLQLKFCLFGDPLFHIEETRLDSIQQTNSLRELCGTSNINSEY